MWSCVWVWVWTWIRIWIHIWICSSSWIQILAWTGIRIRVRIWNRHPLARTGVTCPTPCSPSIPRLAAPAGAQSTGTAPGAHPPKGCCPLTLPGEPRGKAGGLQQLRQEPWPPSRGEGQNGSGPAGLGCCSAVRLGLNVLQGGAEVREGDECRKHIKRGKLAAASTAA